MTGNDIHEKVSMPLAEFDSIESVDSIGKKWLNACSCLFDNDVQYGLNENGKSMFIPSTLRHSVSTDILVNLLKTADGLERFQETSGIVNENYYLNSITSHLRQRSDNGDVQAKHALYSHAQQKIIHSEV